MIETERLLLRPPALDDAQALMRLLTPEITGFLATWQSPFTEEMAIERILAAQALAVGSAALTYAILQKSDGQLVGWASVGRDDSEESKGSLGYWIGESFHGKGFGHEAAQAIIATAFHEMKLALVEAGVQLSNGASRAILEKCGMRFVEQRTVRATSRGRDEPCDVYELSRSVWEASSKRRPA